MKDRTGIKETKMTARRSRVGDSGDGNQIKSQPGRSTRQKQLRLKEQREKGEAKTEGFIKTGNKGKLKCPVPYYSLALWIPL